MFGSHFIFFGMKLKAELKKENPNSEVANNLLELLTNEIARRYDFMMDGKAAFSPEEVEVENAGFFVLWVNRKPVGCGALRPLFENRIVEVKRMFVLPEYRRQGLARRITNMLETEARTFGYSKIWLETGDRQPEAIQLYEGSGYTRIENYGTYKNNLHSNCFEKILL